MRSVGGNISFRRNVRVSLSFVRGKMDTESVGLGAVGFERENGNEIMWPCVRWMRNVSSGKVIRIESFSRADRSVCSAYWCAASQERVTWSVVRGKERRIVSRKGGRGCWSAPDSLFCLFLLLGCVRFAVVGFVDDDDDDDGVGQLSLSASTTAPETSTVTTRVPGRGGRFPFFLAEEDRSSGLRSAFCRSAMMS